MKKRIVFIVMLILDIGAIFCLLLAYGPYNGFRNFLITTAMTSKSHKYFARTIYSEETINKVMSQNYIVEVEEETNTDEIIFENQDTNVYESIYEEQILKRDPGNDLYKIIEFSGSEYHAYLVAIYDPSRVSLLTSQYLGTRGEHLSVMARKNNAILAINGGGFLDINEVGDGGTPTGIVIKDGKVLNDDGTKGKIIGFNKDNVLVLGNYTADEAINAGIRDALEFGPFLIVNGKASSIYGNGGWGKNPRTVIAQRKDGIVLFLVIDGNGVKHGYRGGIELSEVIEILLRYKAYNAANLDGGASTNLIVNNEIYSNPVAYSDSGERWIPTGWMVR